MYGASGTARSDSGSAVTTTKTPVFGPPLCSWPVEWRYRGPKPAIVAQSDKIQVFVNLDVDLKSEHINADIKTVPQKGLGVSVSDLVNPYIKVDGTLAHPTLVLDPKGVLIEGGAAVATAGLSILAMSIKDRFLSPKDQCGKAIEEAAGDFEQIRKKYRPEPPQ